MEGEDVFEFVRGSAVDTFLVLTHTGQITREEVVDYYQSLFGGKLLREYNQVWNALACAVADLPAPELIGDLRKVFKEGLVDHCYADLADLERDACVPFERKKRWKQEKLSALVSDAVSEMSWWAAFEADPRPKPRVFQEEPIAQTPPFPEIESAEAEDYAPEAVPSTGVRRGPKIGRNAPCPCGSGKKYKKCCLGK